MKKSLRLFIIPFLFYGCKPGSETEANKNYQSETLIIEKITDHVYQHISFLDAGSFGNVPCNGMIVFSDNEAIIFDTPTDTTASLELISWVKNELNCEIKAIIPTHFHVDCLGALDEFHKHGIPSYANNLTIELAKSNDRSIPENGFDSLLELNVGEKKVLAEFFGEGHTKDNVIGYFPDEEVVFGGCLIKELGAGNGNLKDATLSEWATTVARLKERHPNVKVVIPGHGKAGGTALYDYTIDMFEPEK